MGFEIVTGEKIDELIRLQKHVINPGARQKEKGSHIEINYKIIGTYEKELSFGLFVRQNKILPNDFSCGLVWNMPGRDTLVLVRYNGSSHCHKNSIEKEHLEADYHIHRATDRYIRAGKKPEGYAELTDKYQSVNGALYHLCSDCNISGIKTIPDQPGLFDEH